MDLKGFLAEFGNERAYVTAHTSGSTGAPKPIRLAKSDMRRSARASNRRFGITAASRLACPLSMDYIAGKMMAVRALEAGCRLDILPVSNYLNLPEGVRYDLIAVVPSQVPSLLHDPQLASKVGQILIGGASASNDICKALTDRGLKVRLSYGMTETCSHVALADGSDPDRIFNAMPGITFETGPDGRLVINAPDFTFNRLTANDLVELKSATSFRWLGRSDNVINSGGLKLIPEQLEAEYAHVIGSNTAFFVTSEAHEKWGHAPLLVIEGTSEQAEQISTALRGSGIDHRHLPARVVAMTEIPRTSTGKIIRKYHDL